VEIPGTQSDIYTRIDGRFNDKHRWLSKFICTRNLSAW